MNTLFGGKSEKENKIKMKENFFKFHYFILILKILLSHFFSFQFK